MSVKIGINDVQTQLHRAHAEGDCAPILMRVLVMMADEISHLQSRINIISEAITLSLAEMDEQNCKKDGQKNE